MNQQPAKMPAKPGILPARLSVATRGQTPVRGDSRGLCGASATAARIPRRVIAVLYAEDVDSRGNITLRKITTTQWLSIPLVASTLGISRVAAWKLVCITGDIPSYKFGEVVRVAASDLADYIAGRKGAAFL